MTRMSKVLLTRIGCRYTCVFCYPQRPYDNPNHSHEENRDRLLMEIDSTPSDCAIFVIGGSDCMEDLDLVFESCDYIRQRRGNDPQIHIQSHCAEYQHADIVERSIKHGVNHILVPVYGPTPEIHHRVMKPKPGTSIVGFPQLEAIDNCLSTGKIGVTAHTVIAEGNAEHLNQTIDAISAMAEKHGTSIDYRIRPVMLTLGSKTENYIPVKNLSPFLFRAHELLLEVNKEKVLLDYRFEGFPFCLFRHIEPRLQNSDFTSRLQTQYTLFVGDQLPASEKHYSEIDPRIPNYRLRGQDPMCEKCLLRKCCAGFQLIDYETYGIGSLQPFC